MPRTIRRPTRTVPRSGTGYASARFEPQGLRLLDLGGGTGATTVVFGRGARELVVLEPDERKVARGRAAGAPMTFVSGFAESIPFEAGRFDRVSSHMSLHHFSDREKVCREAARVLTDGGRFVIFDMHRHSLMVRWLSVVAGRTHHVPERFPTASELEGDLRAAGFRRMDREELRQGWLVVATR